MKVGELIPPVGGGVRFEFTRLGLIPEAPGCYCLAARDGEVLYIGKAKNLRRRMKEHFLDGGKTETTERGVAFWVHYRRMGRVDDLGKLERGWMNEYEIVEGEKPPLNKILPGV